MTDREAAALVINEWKHYARTHERRNVQLIRAVQTATESLKRGDTTAALSNLENVLDRITKLNEAFRPGEQP